MGFWLIPGVAGSTWLVKYMRCPALATLTSSLAMGGNPIHPGTNWWWPRCSRGRLGDSSLPLCVPRGEVAAGTTPTAPVQGGF